MYRGQHIGGRGDGRGGRGGRGQNGYRNRDYEEAQSRSGGYRGRGSDHRGNGNRGSHNDGNQRTTYPIGLAKFKTLAETTCDSDLLEGLTMDGSFYKLINKEQQPQDDFRRLILRVLARACQFNVAHFRCTLHGLLRHVAQSQFLQKWLPSDVLQLRHRLHPFSTATDSEREKFIEEATILLSEILDKLPDMAMEIRQTATTVLDTLKDNTVFREFQGSESEEPTFRRAQRSLEIQWETYIERKRQQPDQAQQMQGGKYDRAPLEDFRELPILPRESEILTDQRPRLRSNKISGAYDSVDHYLDVQFRLLREDFVGPIREAITSVTELDLPEILKQANHGHKPKPISIYRHAHFQEPEFDQRSTTMVYRMRFDMTPFRKMNWETSRRLQRGSLLCFWSDGFHTLFFATIFSRDVQELNQGNGLMVTIDRFPAGGLDRSAEYSFVESPSFFEAYKHVLKALQAIRGEQDVPFVRHLVFCESVVEPPRYIRDNGAVDFSCLLVDKEDGENTIANDVLQLTDWPSKEQLGLDESQFEALRQALTKRLAIIQGPPGTGKTYVGLKIVQMLLDKTTGMGPMLIVCFTNHALDQFLEGIAAFMPNGGRNAIIRIGGSAKMSETVKQFQLAPSMSNPSHLSMKRSEERRERELVELKIEAMKKMTTEQNGWLTSEQITRVTGGQSGQLFEEARRHRGVVKNDEDALRIWLGDARAWKEPSAREVAAARRLVWLTGFHLDTCLKAIWLTGNRCEYDAIQWLKKLFDLTEYGCNESEACFALELNYNDAQAAFNWLNQSTGQRQLPRGAQARQVQRSRIDLAQPNEPDEHVEIGAEALEPERDFLDGYDFVGEDPKSAVADPQFDDVFTRVGRQPQLFQSILNSIAVARPMSATEAERAMQNPWQLPVPERWRLYRYWQERFWEEAEHLQRALEQKYHRHTEVLGELDNLCLVHQLREVKVIGMTTTGAAKKQAVLQHLQPKVIVIEEAAEVLEAHIVTSLSSGCEHLILIGDHKQLRPKPSVYELAKRYNFDVSLFERLINNNFAHATLREQHRMRPEIADVLMLQFYDDLRNHASVYNRDHVRGLTSDMYFIDHRHFEENGDGTSHKNMHEAHFMVALCKYLIQQGYQAEKITILCCYLAQMFEIKKLIVSTFPEHDRVRLAVVDNYQGEENDIILLSMVRSNNDGRVGFLKTDNRVCVALSRAKVGLYVIGNFQHLADNSPLWAALVERLRAGNSLGPALELRCQIHACLRQATQADDFVREAPNGGCSEICDTRMACGHVCNQRCHPIDPRHENVHCVRQCERACPQGHKCPKLCFDDCGDCHVQIQKTLPCGHTLTAECHQAVETIVCKEKCAKVLPTCGHTITAECHQAVEKIRCREKCAKVLPCGHTITTECHQAVEKIRCREKCTKILPCGHTITTECHQAVETIRCREKCAKVLPCGHTITAECHQAVETIRCREKCIKILPCGHQCQQQCSDPCNAAKCRQPVERSLPCGHVATLPCNTDTSNYACPEKVMKRMPNCEHDHELACSVDVHVISCPAPCGAILNCGDPCSGTCGQCRRGRLHKKCDADCKRILLCGHECKEKCSNACPLCPHQCENRCAHSRCGQSTGKGRGMKKGRTCGEPCPPCVERCTWSCKHHRCKLPCYEPCQRQRCTEKCPKKLRCRHYCIGVCGEPCPKVCRKCDKQKYEEILERQEQLLPIDEDKKKTAMFVQLNDCQHVFEVNFLDTWFDEVINQAKDKQAAEIKLPQCPLCNTPVRSTERYGAVFKLVLLDVQQVKIKERGETKELERNRDRLASHLYVLCLPPRRNFKEAGSILRELVTKSETFHLTKNRLVSLENLVQLFGQLVKSDESAVRKPPQKAVPKGRSIALLGPVPSCRIGNESAASRFIDQFFPMKTVINELKCKELEIIVRRERDFLFNWIVRNAKSPSQQMIEEFANECRRMMLLASLIEVLIMATNKAIDMSEHWTQVEEIMGLFNGANTFNRELEKSAAEKIKRLTIASQCETGLGIGDKERVEIVKAMGFSQGHWFKCPNGHVYCIGEYGGATEESTCPECHAGIGGTRHNLRSDNAVASEMDGATRPAYYADPRADAAVARRLQAMW